jgi:thioredoxin-like negative regulator of GroEL
VSSQTQTNESAATTVADAPPSAPSQTTTGSAKPTLLFFYTATSGNSRRAEGFLAQILQHRGNHQTFTLRRIDYDEHSELATRLGVKQPPAIIVVEAKRLRARLEQPRGCTDIRAALAPWLK